jgi:hypothetical protein
MSPPPAPAPPSSLYRLSQQPPPPPAAPPPAAPPPAAPPPGLLGRPAPIRASAARFADPAALLRAEHSAIAALERCAASNRLHLAGIRRLVKASGRAGMVAAETPLLLSRACELLLKDLAVRAVRAAAARRAESLQARHPLPARPSPAAVCARPIRSHVPSGPPLLLPVAAACRRHKAADAAAAAAAAAASAAVSLPPPLPSLLCCRRCRCRCRPRRPRARMTRTAEPSAAAAAATAGEGPGVGRARGGGSAPDRAVKWAGPP